MSDNALAAAAARIEELTRELATANEAATTAQSASEAQLAKISGDLAASMAARRTAELARDEAVAQRSDLQQQVAALRCEKDQAKSDVAVKAAEGAAEVAAEREARQAAERARDAAVAEVAAAKAAGLPDPRLQARVAELEALLADPPETSSVEIVQYLATDGTVTKRRYRASDGSKHRLLPDALRQEAKLALMDMGLTEIAADAMVSRSDAVVKHLQALKA